MKIKLCGFSETKSLSFAVESGCDFVGVVFVKNSIRYVNPIKSKVLSEIILSKSSKVAVVANHQLDDLKVIYENFAPDYFQLHGSENVDYIINLKKHFPKIGIIKAFAIENSSDLLKIKIYEDFVDYFLFDNKNAGSGQSFDWQHLENTNFSKEWFLSGGININNLHDALKINKFNLIDISSGIEEERGIKSIRLIKELMQKFHQLKQNQHLNF